MSKTKKLLVSMTPEDHAAIAARYPDRAMGPAMVDAALARERADVVGRYMAQAAPRPPSSPAEWRTRMAAALDATDAVVAAGGKLPLALGPVRAALVALRGAVRTS